MSELGDAMLRVSGQATGKRCVIIRRGILKQKWYASFIAVNDLKLARTTEHYHNLGDLTAMLKKYFPDWPVEVRR